MEQTAFTSDGESLAYRVWGHKNGATPLMTVHGLVSSVHHWLDFNPYYAARRQVISWEYRGHGGNPPPRDPAHLSVAQFADDANAVWATTGAPPVVIVGLSFGVQVALELYRRHPDCIRALVLICGTAGHPLDRVSPSPSLRRNMAAVVRALGSQRLLASPLLSFLRTRVGTRIAREITYLSGGANRDSCPPAMLQGLFKHVGSLDPRVVAAVTAGYLEHDAHDVLPSIDVPTLIIAGDRDQLTPVETAIRMREAIPDSELVVFPGHSHLVQVEKPREVHAAIDAFLAKHQL